MCSSTLPSPRSSLTNVHRSIGCHNLTDSMDESTPSPPPSPLHTTFPPFRDVGDTVLMSDGTTRGLHVQWRSEFTIHWSLILNLVPGIVSGTKRDSTCTVRAVLQWIHYTTTRVVRYPCPPPPSVWEVFMSSSCRSLSFTSPTPCRFLSP